MATRTFRALKQSDSDVISALGEIADRTNLGEAAQVVVAIVAQHRIKCRLADVGSQPQLTALLAARTAMTESIQLSGGSNWSILVKREGYDDEVTVSIGDAAEQTPTEMAITILAAAHEKLRAYSRTEATNKLLGPELSEFYQKREEGLLRLENLSQRLIEENEAYRHKTDQGLEVERKTLEERFAARYLELEKDHGTKHQLLLSREVALEEKIKGLDDRDSRFVRREIRQDLKRALAGSAKRFELSQSTTKKRWVLHVLFATLIGISIYSLYYAYAVGLSFADGSTNWPNVVRSLLTGVAFAIAMVFYIRWNDDWFRQHANEEFRLKRLELDIDRASWVVEMAMEWTREKDAGVIPREIMEGITRNLFADPLAGRFSHPTEDLASALLGASTGLSMKVPGIAELQLDRKGIQRFRTNAEESKPTA